MNRKRNDRDELENDRRSRAVKLFGLDCSVGQVQSECSISKSTAGINRCLKTKDGVSLAKLLDPQNNMLFYQPCRAGSRTVWTKEEVSEVSIRVKFAAEHFCSGHLRRSEIRYDNNFTKNCGRW